MRRAVRWRRWWRHQPRHARIAADIIIMVLGMIIAGFYLHAFLSDMTGPNTEYSETIDGR